uniref:SRY (Sex determining region Y)-box 7 n=1 Tax=Schistosoma japonicum TaxID=6182 RepID=C1LJ44_SCHJA|nr:SRY (sex determining region Y)-box 7 [Schistosoma japonicum]
MLSEKRKKVRYSTDPNGVLWANNPNNFGRKMLEKSGWTPGKGLGKNSDGIKAPIKASLQKGTRGLGLKSDFCLGVKQIDEYASLLRKLNDIHNNSNKTSQVNECLPPYSKRGTKTMWTKEASKYNEKDLSIVLGHPRMFLEENMTPTKASVNNSDVQIPTVISSLSVSEYFTQAKKRKLQCLTQNCDSIATPAKLADTIIPGDQPATSVNSQLCTNYHDNIHSESVRNECNKMEEKSVHKEDADKKARHIKTINAGENIINSLFIQSNLLSIRGYCYY